MNFISPETEAFMLNEIAKLQSTPEDPPVNRLDLESQNRDLNISIRENRPYCRKSLDSHKVWETCAGPVVFLGRDKVITMDLKYNRSIAATLWLRIYPTTTSNEYLHKTVASCSAHKKHIFNKHTDNNAIHVLNSIFELNDPATLYEVMSLPFGDRQVTARVRYFNPETSVHMSFKCYNTCIEVFGHTRPKLNFSIETYNEEKKEFTVLSEASVQFKVCASPTRDYKTEVLPLQQKRLSLKSSIVAENQNGAIRSNNIFQVAGQIYGVQVLTESEIDLIDTIRSQCGNCGNNNEIEDFEKRITRLVHVHLENGAVKTEMRAEPRNDMFK